MAVIQDASCKNGISLVAQEDSGGYFYTTLGGIRVYVGSGSPHGVIIAPMGSVYIETGTGALWSKGTNGTGTDWIEAT